MQPICVILKVELPNHPLDLQRPRPLIQNKVTLG